MSKVYKTEADYLRETAKKEFTKKVARLVLLRFNKLVSSGYAIDHIDAAVHEYLDSLNKALAIEGKHGTTTIDFNRLIKEFE